MAQKVGQCDPVGHVAGLGLGQISPQCICDPPQHQFSQLEVVDLGNLKIQMCEIFFASIECPDSKYVGESDRNLFSRGREHQKNKSGFVVKHQDEKHI